MLPNLPVLDEIRSKVAQPVLGRIRNTMLLAGIHVLKSNGSLLKALIAMGMKPEHMFVLGKVYSSNREVAQEIERLGIRVLCGRRPARRGGHRAEMIQEAAELCSSEDVGAACERTVATLVLDDGGYMTVGLKRSGLRPREVCVVEQTASGRFADPAASRYAARVLVGSSFAKRRIEAAMISKAVLDRCKDALMHCAAHRVGVIGVGSIGYALAKDLVHRQYVVTVYDNNDERRTAVRGATYAGSAALVVRASDLVFGCTGFDAVDPRDLLRHPWPGQKTLASCSSSDTEFRSVIETLDQREGLQEEGGEPCPDFVSDEWRLRILRCGFPINFDNSPESVSAERIQLTRGLMLAGAIQALELGRMGYSHTHRDYKLAPSLQVAVVQAWGRAIQPTRLEQAWIDRFVPDSLSKIAMGSGGNDLPAQLNVLGGC